jgi:HEAT repeat protein
MRMVLTVLALGLIVSVGAFAQVSIKGASAGVGLNDIKGTTTLVTITLKGSGATDPNCRIVDVGPDYFRVSSENGDRYNYTFEGVDEIVVQGGRVELEKFEIDARHALTPKEQDLLNKALETAAGVYDRSISNQTVKISAAVLLALGTDKRAEDAQIYLNRLAESNDLRTAFTATIALYMVKDIEPTSALMQTGLTNGDSRVRAMTVLVIGLLRQEEYEERLLSLVKERQAETSAAAAFALGRLKSQRAVPDLLNMIVGLNRGKAESAKLALIEIGGDAVISGLRERVNSTSGLAQFRLIQALYELDDPLGARLMKDESMKTPTLALAAALALAGKGDIEARDYLSKKLSARWDRIDRQYNERSEIAAVLIKGGDRSADAVLREALSSDSVLVQLHALTLIANSGARSLVDLPNAALLKPDDAVVIAACEAVVALLDPDFSSRLKAIGAQN